MMGLQKKVNQNTILEKVLEQLFLEIEPEEEEFLKNLYTCVRNGLFHAGVPRSNVILSNDLPGSFGHKSGTNLIAINPDMLVEDLQIHFSEYASRLRDKSNIELRSKFEARFNYHDDGH